MRLVECLLALYLYITWCDSIKQGCEKSKWGDQCEKNCSTRCYNLSCDKVTGLCAEGCMGYASPPECLGYCMTGYFGLNCAQPCPINCKDNACNPFIGRCYLCAAGFRRSQQSSLCDLVCESGTWGLFCNNTCAVECEGACSPLDGICSNGACPDGKWGYKCEYYCSGKCFNRTCNSITGACECRSELCQQRVVPENATSFFELFKDSLKLIQFYAILVAVVLVFVYVWLLEKRRNNDDSVSPPPSESLSKNEEHSRTSLY